jgi:hypothetical protein
MTAAQVFYNMHTFIQSLHFTNEDNMAAVDRARQLSLVLGTCFFTGWLLFPIGFSLGPNFGDAISERSEMVFFFFGDILAKNMYVGLMVIFKHYFVPLAEGGGVDAEMAAAGIEDSRRVARRRPSQMITQEMIGTAQEMRPASNRTSVTRSSPAGELESAHRMQRTECGGGGGGGGGGSVSTEVAIPDSAAVSAAVQAAVEAGYRQGMKEAARSRQRQNQPARQEAPQEDSDDDDADRNPSFSRLKVRRCPAHAHAPCGGPSRDVAPAAEYHSQDEPDH